MKEEWKKGDTGHWLSWDEDFNLIYRELVVTREPGERDWEGNCDFYGLLAAATLGNPETEQDYNPKRLHATKMDAVNDFIMNRKSAADDIKKLISNAEKWKKDHAYPDDGTRQLTIDDVIFEE